LTWLFRSGLALAGLALRPLPTSPFFGSQPSPDLCLKALLRIRTRSKNAVRTGVNDEHKEVQNEP
ncbi:MAG: hypothetical protein OEL78_07015, partial [Hyphomicrobiales bacterium]|nr:hypothetical protein [Hyphomicrobiales bacterium]